MGSESEVGGALFVAPVQCVVVGRHRQSPEALVVALNVVSASRQKMGRKCPMDKIMMLTKFERESCSQ